MKLLRLLFRESSLSPWFVLFIASLSGLSNSLLLAVINAATQQPPRNSQVFGIILFIVVLGSYLLFQRYLLIITINEIERILHRVRVRIINKVKDAELLPLEQLGKSVIYASVTKEMQTISTASIGMVILAQSGLLIIFTLVYVGFLSVVALTLFIIFFSIGALLYLFKMARFAKEIHEGLTFENELFDALTHLIDGFKEVKMSERRAADLIEHISAISTSVKDIKANAMVAISLVSAFAGAAFYVLAAIVVFILPRIGEYYSHISTDLATCVLFLAGPLGYLVGSVQIYETANAAADNLESLEAALDRHVRPASRRKAQELAIRQYPFTDIVFEQVQFEYSNNDRQINFRLGPIDLSISQGETIFVTGGNGSGKSTFLRLLTCLYFPTKGEVRLDGQRLSEANATTYRELFSVIFYDYHLFDKLYGLHNIDRQYVDQLLQLMKMKGVTRLVDSRFDPLDLSSGQKRRLALLVSYLEDKPIMVFDEFAAEQDPDFRRYFYTSILPELRARGKTIIAVTHDDQYHNMGYIDRIIKFEEGRIVSEN